MKKIYTLALLALMAAPALAEVESDVFQFVDSEGNTVTDGAELTFTDVVDPWGDGSELQVPMPVRVKNTSDDQATASMKLEVVSLDNGMFSSCAFGLCQMYGATGTYQRGTKDLAAGAIDELRTEWQPEAYGQCTVRLTLQQYDMGDYLEGPTITVHFLYADPSPVAAATAGHSEATARYTLAGGRIARGQKGINIVRYSDGSTAKVAQR